MFNYFSLLHSCCDPRNPCQLDQKKMPVMEKKTTRKNVRVQDIPVEPIVTESKRGRKILPVIRFE